MIRSFFRPAVLFLLAALPMIAPSVSLAQPPGEVPPPRPVPAPPPGVEPETAVLPAVAPAPPPATFEAPTTGTLALLRSLEARHGETKTFKGSFVQIKVSEIFLEETKSSGTFWFSKPSLFRCDYAPPDEMTNFILNDAIYIHVPALEQVEVYRFRNSAERDQQLHVMVLVFGFKTDNIIREYRFLSSEDDEKLRAELIVADQKPEEIALLYIEPMPHLLATSPFVKMKVWIDKTTLRPLKIRFEDYNGETTTIEILDIGFGEEFDPLIFTPQFPKGTEILDKTNL